MLTNLTNKCLVGFKKNIMQVVLYSVKRQQKTLCRPKPTKEMKDFVAAGSCVNEGRTHFRKCGQKVVNNMFKIKHAEDKLKVPMICWLVLLLLLLLLLHFVYIYIFLNFLMANNSEIVKTKQCLLKQSKKVSQCTEKHIETLQNRFNQVSMNGINIACGDYSEDTDRCDNVHVPNIAVERSDNSSIVLALFQLLDSVPDSENFLPGTD